MRSRSSCAVKVGRSTPFAFIDFRHGGAVVPHGRGDVDGRGELLERVQVRPHDAARAADLMADDALLLREELAARGRVARRVEVVEGVEEADQVARLLRGELRARDPELLHPVRHARQVVPHLGGDVVEGARLESPREVGADLAADSVDRVALDTALGAEDPRAGQRVLARAEHGLGPRRVERPRSSSSATSDGPLHGSDHWRPFLPGSRRPPGEFLPTVADATRISARSQDLLELEPEHARCVRVPHLGVVEHRHAEGVLLLEIVELHVVFTAGRFAWPRTTTGRVHFHDRFTTTSLSSAPSLGRRFRESTFRGACPSAGSAARWRPR